MENHKFFCAETMRQTCKTLYKSHQARNPKKNQNCKKNKTKTILHPFCTIKETADIMSEVCLDLARSGAGGGVQGAGRNKKTHLIPSRLNLLNFSK